MKQPFLVFGITLLFTIIVCETIGYYGYNKIALVGASIVSAIAGAIVLLSVVPDTGINQRFKHYTVVIALSLIVGSVLWFLSDARYSETINERFASNNNLYRISDSINVKTYNGYYTTVICQETGAHTSLLTKEKLIVSPGDTLVADIVHTVDHDRKLYNKSQGIHFSGEVNGKTEIIQNSELSIDRLFYTLKKQIARNIDSETADASGFLKALILGDKSGLSFEDKTVLQRAGVYHICAVSGQHVSIMCMFIAYIIDFLNIKRNRIRFAITFPILLFLLGITGFSVSALRAVFMTSCALFGKVMLRRTDSLNFLGLVLSLILIFSPTSAYSVSLLLSFSATIGIILLSNPIKEEIITSFFLKTGKILPDFCLFLIGIFSVSVAATVFTVTVSVFFFSSVSLCGIIANLFVLPIVTVVYILTVIMILFSFIPACAPCTLLFAQLAKIGVKLVMNISSWFTESVFSNVDLSLGTIGSCALLALLSAVIYLYKNRKKSKKKRKQRLAYSGVIFAVIFLVSLFGGTAVKSVADPSDDLYHVAFIDVGQGMSAVVSYGENAIIIDCGGSKTVSSAITDYLNSKSIKNIDSVILSHLHSDHCNAFVSLVDEWDIPEVIIPYTEGDPALYIEILDAVDNEGADLVVLEDDIIRKIGNMSLCILTEHLDSASSDQNENSLVVIADIASMFRVLFSGDITFAAEDRLIEHYGRFLDCKVLSVPHHGSKYSSSEEFLDAVSPILSVISVGKNTYGHPTDETLKRLREANSQVITTMDYGTIEIVTDGFDWNVVYGD